MGAASNNVAEAHDVVRGRDNAEVVALDMGDAGRLDSLIEKVDVVVRCVGDTRRGEIFERSCMRLVCCLSRFIQRSRSAASSTASIS